MKLNQYLSSIYYLPQITENIGDKKQSLCLQAAYILEEKIEVNKLIFNV